MNVYLVFAVSIIVTMVLLPPLMRHAGLLGLVDVPDERKVHSGRMPRVGGIAIVIGTMLPIILLSGYESQFFHYIAAVAVLFIFGVLDDRVNLDYRLKLLGQVIAAGIVVIGSNTVIGVLPFFGLDPQPQYITVPFTTLVLVGVTNAINLADGLDGLAAGTTLLTVAAIALLAYLAEGQDILLISLALCGSLIGFLRFNTYPAKVFMGDTGSQFLGFTAGYLAIELTQNINTALNPALPLLLLGLPLLDVFLVMAKRVRDRRSLFSPDNNHFHHQLLARGLDHTGAVAVIYIIHGLFVFSAIAFGYYSDLFILSLYAISIVFIAGSMFIAGRIYWARRENRHTLYLSRFTSRYKLGERSYRLAGILVKYGLAAFFVCGVLFAADISSDLGVLAAFMAVIMLLRLALADWLRFIPLRIFMYISSAIVLYIVAIAQPETVIFTSTLQAVFFTTIAIASLYAMSRDQAFVVNTTDLLVLLLVAVVIFLPEVASIDIVSEAAFIQLVILFYACELVISSMQRQWTAPVMASLFAFVAIAFRGLL